MTLLSAGSLPRRLLPLAFTLVAACSDNAYSTWSAPDDNTGPPEFFIGGVVTDSLLGSAIPGARVAAGKFVTQTDAGGQWSLQVPRGPITVATSPAGYESSFAQVDVRGPMDVDLMVRRLAPVVQDCERDGDLVHAYVSDLQGRKTIERWNQSVAIVEDPAGAYRVGAINWVYEAVDYITWKVTLGPISAGTSLISWEVYDSEGHVYTGACDPIAAGGQD